MIVAPVQGICVMAATAGSSYFKNTRTYWMALTVLISLGGAIMIRQIKPAHIWARFIGFCFLSAFSANFPMMLVMVVGNTGGFTKKTTVNAMVKPKVG